MHNDQSTQENLITIPDTPNSQLIITPNHGYNTFEANNIDSIILENLDEYDSSYLLNNFIDKHPTQSMFSLSMQYMNRLSKERSASTALFRNSRIYSFCGEMYRKCCFTSKGMKLKLSTNVLLMLLNLYLIVYEAILLSESRGNGGHFDTHLPISFFICDIFITIVLIVEVLLHWYIGYMCSCHEYLCNSTLDNRIDAVVMTVSVLCCILYLSDLDNSEDIDNLLFLVIRIVRDLLRIIRCYYFFKLLHADLRFDLNQIRVASFHVKTQQKVQSIGSNVLWDKYIEQRELHTQSSVYKVPPGKIFKATSIPENEPSSSIDNDVI